MSNSTMNGTQQGMSISPAAAYRQAVEAGKSVTDMVRAHPVWALGLSLGMGVIVGWLIKRR